jgi:hypothetical protein
MCLILLALDQTKDIRVADNQVIADLEDGRTLPVRSEEFAGWLLQEAARIFDTNPMWITLWLGLIALEARVLSQHFTTEVRGKR